MIEIYDEEDWMWYEHEFDQVYDHDILHVCKPEFFPCIVSTEVRYENNKVLAIHKFEDFV